MIVEIRTYRLKPGTRDEFVELVRTRSIPLLAAHGITVLDAGGSLVDEDGYEEAYLIRSFDSVADRKRQVDSFYGSDDWLLGPREDIVSRIESYHTIVLDIADGMDIWAQRNRNSWSGSMTPNPGISHMI